MTDTLTMQQVADLARVQRPVVSVWRKRHADFPEPTTIAPVTFDAGSVAEWLAKTRRGNNPEAAIDVLLHSSRLDVVRARLSDASTLLLLQTILGEPLAHVDAGRALDVAAGSALGELLSPPDVLTAHSDEDLVGDVDALVEAGFNGEPVLWRLVDAQRRPGMPFADSALSDGGCDLVASLLRELTQDASRSVVAHGVESLAVLAQATGGERIGVDTRVAFSGVSAGAEVPLVLRAFAARGVDIVADDDAGDCVHLLVGLGRSGDAVEQFFMDLRAIGQSLGRRDVAVVLAPSDWLVEANPETAGAKSARRAFFNIDESSPAIHDKYAAPLRYVAPLPKGLLRHGGRRRLAMYVLANSRGESDAFTVYGDHINHTLDRAECDELAADVMAAVAGKREKHAFLRAHHQLTAKVLRGKSPVITSSTSAPRDGGEALAAAWEREIAAGGSLAPGVELESAGLVTPHEPVPWAKVIADYADLRPGRRIADELCDAEAGAVVIGPDEVRGLRSLGARRIDRLVLERTAPRAKFTEPGDVVFVNVGGAAAIVDERGGRLVQSPARILRSRREPHGGRLLTPAVAALDIAAQSGTDVAGWNLHVTPADQADAVAAVASGVATRRGRLRAQLVALEKYETTVLPSLASGVLRGTVAPMSVMQTETVSPTRTPSSARLNSAQ